jgi:hypothetical protein
MKTFKSILLGIVISFCLLSCSSNTPSSSDGRAIEESKLSQTGVKMVSFEKINGVPQNIMGMNVYELDYKATVEFTKNGYVSVENGYHLGEGAESKGFFLKNILAYLDVYNSPESSGNYHTESVSIGKQITIICKVMLQKTENGWREYGNNE